MLNKIRIITNKNKELILYNDGDLKMKRRNTGEISFSHRKMTPEFFDTLYKFINILDLKHAESITGFFAE